jgi:four helix bundle protein
MRDFRKMRVWSQAMDLAEVVYVLLKGFPKEEEYGLKAQLRRAAVSISSNIAEGCSRSSQKEFRYYTEIALGSCFELESQLILATRLKMVKEVELSRFLEKIHIEQRQIHSLINSVNAMI